MKFCPIKKSAVSREKLMEWYALFNNRGGSGLDFSGSGWAWVVTFRFGLFNLKIVPGAFKIQAIITL
jgi:hypothetical protein